MPTTKHNLISLRIGIPKFLVLKGPEKKQDMKVLHMSGRSERYVADPIIHHAFFLRSESTLCHSELLILGNIFYSILFYYRAVKKFATSEDLRFANSEDFTFLMPCCIGCSEINKIN